MLPRGRWRPIAPECLPSYPPRGPVGPAGPGSSPGSPSERRNAPWLSRLLTRLPRTPPRVTFRRGPVRGCRLRGSVSRGVALCGSPVKVPASSRSPLFPVRPLPWRVPVELHRTPSPRREAGADAGPVSDSLARSLPRVPPLSLPCEQERMLAPFSAAVRLSPGALAPALDRASGFLRPGEGRCLLGGRRGFTPWPKPRVHPDRPIRVAAPRRCLRAGSCRHHCRVYRP
jgi:hypothetical protein